MGNTSSTADEETREITDDHGWQTNICACCSSSAKICVFVWCCPSCAHGAMVRMVRHDEDIEPCTCDGRCVNPNCAAFFCTGGMWHTGASCLNFMLRGEIRRAYGIDGSGTEDLCCHCWCDACTTCQEYSELRMRIREGWVRPKGIKPTTKRGRATLKAPIVPNMVALMPGAPRAVIMDSPPRPLVMSGPSPPRAMAYAASPPPPLGYAAAGSRRSRFFDAAYNVPSGPTIVSSVPMGRHAPPATLRPAYADAY